MKHTATPWFINTKSVVTRLYGRASGFAGNNGDAIAEIKFLGDAATKRANAAFIVKAVNCHAELVERLEESTDLLRVLMKAVDDPENALTLSGMVLLNSAALTKANAAAATEGDA